MVLLNTDVIVIKIPGLQGPGGSGGTGGSTLISGDGAPANGLGANGNWYQNRTNNDWYEKVSNAWVKRGITLAPATHTHVSTQVTDFTEAVQDVVGNLITGSTHTGITWSYNDASNTLSATVAASGGSTDAEVVRDTVAAALRGTRIDIVHDDANDTITLVANVTKADVGLGNVDNTSDANKPVSSATQTALNAKAPTANPTFTGTVSGVTKGHVGLGNVDNTADSAKPVSTAQAAAITSARDRSNHTGTQATTTITNFVEEVQDIVGAMVVAGSNVTVNYDDTNGRIEITSVGGGGGTGTTDPEVVRDTIAAALRNGSGITITNDDAADTITITSLLRTVAGKAPSAGDVSLVVTDIVGLQTALDAKAPTASPTFTGTVSGVSKSMVGLGNVDNTSDANKPVSSAQQLALDTKANTSHTHAAGNITSGTLGIDRVALGSTIVVDYYKGFYGAANAWPSARPTTRTDITVIAKGPGAVDSSQPPLSWMIDGDDWDREV